MICLSFKLCFQRTEYEMHDATSYVVPILLGEIRACTHQCIIVWHCYQQSFLLFQASETWNVDGAPHQTPHGDRFSRHAFQRDHNAIHPLLSPLAHLQHVCLRPRQAESVLAVQEMERGLERHARIRVQNWSTEWFIVVHRRWRDLWLYWVKACERTVEIEV